MGVSLPMPQEAKDALARVDQMHDDIAAMRNALDRLLLIARAYARRDGLEIEDA